MTTTALTPASALPAATVASRPAARSGAELLAEFTAWAAGAFYQAEVGHNPAVRDYWDAFHYVATSLSVGYANIFPVTTTGKIVASLVMMFGPALSARALDPPSPVDADRAR